MKSQNKVKMLSILTQRLDGVDSTRCELISYCVWQPRVRWAAAPLSQVSGAAIFVQSDANYRQDTVPTFI